MRTLHLLKTPDILCANDSRLSISYWLRNGPPRTTNPSDRRHLEISPPPRLESSVLFRRPTSVLENAAVSGFPAPPRHEIAVHSPTLQDRSKFWVTSRSATIQGLANPARVVRQTSVLVHDEIQPQHAKVDFQRYQRSSSVRAKMSSTPVSRSNSGVSSGSSAMKYPAVPVKRNPLRSTTCSASPPDGRIRYTPG